MTSLQNLIPDPTTKGLWQCRPACIRLTNFGSFTTPGFVSISKVFGQFVYGFVASGRNPGYDEPFCFNILTGQFVTVSGITPNNVPASPGVAGAWTPPTAAMIGAKICFTHPGFSGAFGAWFGYFDVSIPLAPTWNPGNCVGAAFPGFSVPPTAVSQFSGRAYFIHNLDSFPAVIFSDVNNPLTNSVSGTITPILTFGDTLKLTALAGLPLENQLGGIIQSLMVFKGDSNIYQITGDASTNNLAINTLNVPTGTLAPASVVPTPIGLGFISPDGFRIIDWDARVSEPLGQDGSGISIPFIYANQQSRITAASNGEVYRITTQNAFVPGNPYQEWWFDFGRKAWYGPHTCAMSSVSPFQNTFIGVLQGVNAALWQSDYLQSVTSTFVENGTTLSWVYQTVLLPDTDEMTVNVTNQTTIDIANSSGGMNVTVLALDQNGNNLTSALLVPPQGAPLWGSVNWGQFNWGGVQSALAPRIVPWPIPVSFVRLAIQASSTSFSGFKIGATHIRYRILRQFIDINAVLPAPATAGNLFILDQSQVGGPDVLG